MNTLFYILRTIAALIAVIWLANIAIKYLNSYSKNDLKNIQVIERISVSKASSLAIVKIVNAYYLMSFSEQTTETIQKFTDEEVIEIENRMKQQQLANDPSEMIKTFDLKEKKEKFTTYIERAMKKE